MLSYLCAPQPGLCPGSNSFGTLERIASLCVVTLNRERGENGRRCRLYPVSRPPWWPLLPSHLPIPWPASSPYWWGLGFHPSIGWAVTAPLSSPPHDLIGSCVSTAAPCHLGNPSLVHGGAGLANPSPLFLNFTLYWLSLLHWWPWACVVFEC